MQKNKQQDLVTALHAYIRAQKQDHAKMQLAMSYLKADIEFSEYGLNALHGEEFLIVRKCLQLKKDKRFIEAIVEIHDFLRDVTDLKKMIALSSPADDDAQKRYRKLMGDDTGEYAFVRVKTDISGVSIEEHKYEALYHKVMSRPDLLKACRIDLQVEDDAFTVIRELSRFCDHLRMYREEQSKDPRFAGVLSLRKED